MTFDRLVYIDRLKGAGVDEAVARAHAEALREALFETVATKDDLLALKSDVKDDILALRSDVKEDIRALRLEMDRKFEAADRKIEITARDLIIKGAGGLVVLAGLMIGLKLFG